MHSAKRTVRPNPHRPPVLVRRRVGPTPSPIQVEDTGKPSYANMASKPTPTKKEEAPIEEPIPVKQAPKRPPGILVKKPVAQAAEEIVVKKPITRAAEEIVVKKPAEEEKKIVVKKPAEEERKIVVKKPAEEEKKIDGFVVRKSGKKQVIVWDKEDEMTKKRFSTMLRIETRKRASVNVESEAQFPTLSPAPTPSSFSSSSPWSAGRKEILEIAKKPMEPKKVQKEPEVDSQDLKERKAFRVKAGLGVVNRDMSRFKKEIVSKRPIIKNFAPRDFSDDESEPREPVSDCDDIPDYEDELPTDSESDDGSEYDDY